MIEWTIILLQNIWIADQMSIVRHLMFIKKTKKVLISSNMEKQKIHNVTDKKSKKTLLKYKKELTTALRKRFMTPGKSVFRYYYDSALKVIEDFKR